MNLFETTAGIEVMSQIANSLETIAENTTEDIIPPSVVVERFRGTTASRPGDLPKPEPWRGFMQFTLGNLQLRNMEVIARAKLYLAIPNASLRQDAELPVMKVVVEFSPLVKEKDGTEAYKKISTSVMQVPCYGISEEQQFHAMLQGVYEASLSSDISRKHFAACKDMADHYSYWYDLTKSAEIIREGVIKTFGKDERDAL